MSKAPKNWPDFVKTVRYPASIDNSQQPMLIYPSKNKKRPLVVGLHTWSSDYRQAGGSTLVAKWAKAYDWHFIQPHYRGPNNTLDACGSEKVIQDILDAVDFMKQHYSVDSERVYLIGGSGGGYTALMMAAKAPKLWAGVSAWVPISDIRAWWEQKSVQNSRYAKDIEKVVGGRPDKKESAAKECIERSPVTFLHQARGVNIDISAGVYDGRKGSVPFTHSLHAFNAIVPDQDKLSQDFIDNFYKNLSPPDSAPTPKPEPDPTYGNKGLIFRKMSGNVRVTIFDGKHEYIQRPGLNWLNQQRKGVPAKWKVGEPDALEIWTEDTESGK